MKTLLAPLEAIYAAALRAKNARYDRKEPQRLQWPVVSVGNLSVGGSGKTPLVILLAQRLAQEGWKPDVLSRGYGRSGRAVERVDPESGNATRFGDEPLMIARAAGVPVFVAADRYQAGLLAERELSGGLRVHLLDDGFQHRKLARTVDIVVIHSADLSDRLLPTGRLREPLTSLLRADIVVVRDEDASLLPILRPNVRDGTAFWRVRRHLSLAASSQDAEPAAPEPDASKLALAFCAIARPQEFFAMLEAGGIALAGRMAFRDHHRYTRKDIDVLSKLAAQCGAAEFVTTEKDAVKLDAESQRQLRDIAPLCVVSLGLELVDEQAALAGLLARLAPPSQSR